MPNSLAAAILLSASAVAALTVADQVPATTAPASSGVIAASDRRDASRLAEAIAGLVARHPGRVSARSAGDSFGKRPIPVITVARDLATADSRPAILVLAGMDGHRWSGTEAALLAVESLAASDAAWLADVTLYVMPRGNPDAAETFARGPRRAYSGDALEHDNDRDGRPDEDPPSDLDGDGVITQLRARGAPHPWPAPTLVTDPAEPRLMRTPEPASGTAAEFTVWEEGFDHDGDGRIAEDWRGGFDPERNFPHRWPEFEDEAGRYPLMAPESLALQRFVDGHLNVFAAVVIGRHDTMVNLPDHKLKTEAGLPHLLDARDADAYGAVAAEWRELSGQKRADGASTAGSFTAWMNVHRGVPTFATTLWGRPDIPEPPAAPEGPAPRAAPKPADEEAAAWLAYSDRVRGGAGFVPWKSVNHPQLRDAEVGGWVAGFRENPPIEELPAIGGRVAGFLGKLADRRPRLVLAAPTATEISPGTWRICAVLRNEGKLPTAMRTGLENRTVPAHVLRISTPLERVRSGQRVTMMRAVESGASMPMEWIVTAAPGEPIELTLAHRGKPVGGWRVTDGAVTPVPAEAPAGGVR